MTVSDPLVPSPGARPLAPALALVRSGRALPAPADDADALVAIRHATLERGTLRFAEWAAGIDGPLPSAFAAMPALRPLVIANGLRELDRFLNHLLDALAMRQGRPAPPERLSTSARLAVLRAPLGVPPADEARLRALGRTRDCLFFCAGVVRRGDLRGGRSMTIGWPVSGDPAGRLARVPVGQTIRVARAEIESVCRFYRRIGNALLAADARAASVA